jgi:hypothetical protein
MSPLDRVWSLIFKYHEPIGYPPEFNNELIGHPPEFNIEIL